MLHPSVAGRAAALVAAVAAGACSSAPRASAPVAAPPPAEGPRPAGPSSAARVYDVVELLVVGTTDQHGRVRGWDYYGNAADGQHSLASAATIVDSLRASAPDRVVLVDAGDLLQGNPLTYVAARIAPELPHPVIAAMNAMGYDAAAVGNHEFNYGLPTLMAAVGQASFPFLAANVYRPDGTRAFPASRMFTRAGVRIGIVGATTPGAAVWDRDKLEGKLVFRDIVPEVRSAVRELRSQGADVVIVTIHSGLNEPASYDSVSAQLPGENVSARVAREIEGIDVVSYGHTHRQLADTTIGTTLLMQAKNWATSVAVATLRLERRAADSAAGPQWRVVARQGTLITTAQHPEAARVLAATQAAHDRTVQYVGTTIGTTASGWRADSARVADSPLTDFVLEVERKASGAQLASTAAFSLGASLDSGAISVAEVARLYPYENTLKAVRVTGRQLRDYLEYSARYFGTYGTGAPAVDSTVPGYNFDIVAGANYTLDLSKPMGARVTRLAIGGRPVRDADTFTLALNNYRQSGGGGYAMLRDAPVVYEGQVEIRQLLIDEVKARGTLRPADYFTRNWELVPRSAIAPALAAMRGNAFEEGGRATRERAAAAAPRPAVPAPTPPRTRPAGRARRLRIAATNDFHGALLPRADSRGVVRGGAGSLATAIRRAADECADDCAFLLLDGGDMFQGTPASNLAFGRPVVAVYNALGYAAAALGNHEFDWGVDTLRARMRDARYRILGANVRFEDGRDVPWIPDDTLVERNGIKVGIIGLASVLTPSVTRAVNVKGLRFDGAARIVDERARALRSRGADAVVVVAHEGAFCDRTGAASCQGEIVTLAQAVTEKVDAIVSGHTHSLVETTVKGIPIVQSRSSGTALGIIDIPLGGGATTITVRDVVTDSLPPDPAVDSIARRAASDVAGQVNQPVAQIAAAMQKEGDEYALGNLIADAQRWAGKADFAVMNNGGIRTGLAAGQATYGSLFEIQPFGNVLHRLSVRGSDVRAYMERLLEERGEQPRYHFAGLRIAYDPTAPAGQRLRALTREDGTAIDGARTYSIILNDFLSTGGAGLDLARRAAKDETIDATDLDALMAYLRFLPQPVRAPAMERVVIRP
ncbi:MAG: 5'-nucleotidase C-terminal domain-containing protein [Gemmatimonadaceae bacterium]